MALTNILLASVYPNARSWSSGLSSPLPEHFLQCIRDHGLVSCSSRATRCYLAVSCFDSPSSLLVLVLVSGSHTVAHSHLPAPIGTTAIDIPLPPSVITNSVFFGTGSPLGKGTNFLYNKPGAHRHDTFHTYCTVGRFFPFLGLLRPLDNVLVVCWWRDILESNRVISFLKQVRTIRFSVHHLNTSGEFNHLLLSSLSQNCSPSPRVSRVGTLTYQARILPSLSTR